MKKIIHYQILFIFILLFNSCNNLIKRTEVDGNLIHTITQKPIANSKVFLRKNQPHEYKNYIYIDSVITDENGSFKFKFNADLRNKITYNVVVRGWFRESDGNGTPLYYFMQNERDITKKSQTSYTVKKDKKQYINFQATPLSLLQLSYLNESINTNDSVLTTRRKLIVTEKTPTHTLGVYVYELPKQGIKKHTYPHEIPADCDVVIDWQVIQDEVDVLKSGTLSLYPKRVIIYDDAIEILIKI